jgi:hypothetical protein
VTVHEFLGTLAYETGARTKVIQFWRMEAAGEPAGDLMRDVMAVDWLTLTDAVNRLSHMRERVFLEQVGPVALKLAGPPAGAGLFQGRDAERILVPDVPLAPVDDVSLSDVAVECASADHDGGRPFGHGFIARHAPTADAVVQAGQAMKAGETHAAHPPIGPHARKSLPEKGPAERGLSEWSLGGKTLMKKTWGWFRYATLLHRQPFD